jgi:NTE family protein
MPETKNVDLVLEGGGVKGIGLVGAVLSLADAGYVFPRVAGTSAGAIVASLIAGFNASGKDIHGLEKIIRGLDYEKFKDGSWLEDHTGTAGEIAELALHGGMYPGEYFREWLGNELSELGISTFADLKIPDAEDPGTGLPVGQRYRLVVHTSDLTNKALARFPWDYPKYGLDPDKQLVVDAVRASMSIPFFFRPVELIGPQGSATLVDGGMLSNYPITVFDRTDGAPNRWPTWGIKLSARPGVQTKLTESDDSAFGVLMGCVETLMGRWDHYHLDDEGVADRTIFVDTFGTSAVDFGLTPEVANRLYENGKSAATAFIAPRTIAMNAEDKTGSKTGNS